MTPAPDTNEIRITRVYDAPVAMVWDAWTDPVQVAQWWGPRGFSLTTHSKDLRAGGTWVYTMHGPDGTDWPNFTRYHVVEPLARLVYDHGASDADAAPMFRMTAIFRDLGGRTELDLTMALQSVEAARNARVFIKAAGGNGTWDRLAEHLAQTAEAREIFVINRSIDAPIATVFAAWTTPSQLAAWLPPAGLAMTFGHADIRTGGSNVFTMANAAFAMHARHDYVEVTRPARLVYVQRFTDADGVVSRHPGAPTWPEATRVTVTFAPEDDGATRITVRFEVDGSVTPEELATFTAERTGMTQGWSGSFDALETLLAAAPARA